MRGVFHLLITIVSLLTLDIVAVTAAEFRAAAAKADITPADRVVMFGYADRAGPGSGTRDPLYAKVLLVDDGKERLAWVTLDLGRPFGNESMNFVRERVKKSASVTQVCFSASHTHSAPMIHEFYQDGKRPAWENVALDKISDAIEAAAKKLQPASIGTGYGFALIGHNRRKVNADGSATMFWRNESKTPTHPVDPRVGVIRIDGPNHAPIAIVVNYACHPVIYGPDNLMYSADYPAAMADVVESGFGGDCLCLFLQGAAGDINPYYDKSKLDEGAETLVRESGKKVGTEALRVAHLITPKVPVQPEIQVSLETRHSKPRYDMEKLKADFFAREMPADFCQRYEIHFATPMELVVTTVLLNREIAIMGIPGEPFVEFGLNFRDRSPVEHSFCAGYCNGFHGYFPTIKAATQGGYGAEGITARVEVGAGESMVNMAIVKLLTMKGLLKPVP